MPRLIQCLTVIRKRYYMLNIVLNFAPDNALGLVEPIDAFTNFEYFTCNVGTKYIWIVRA